MRRPDWVKDPERTSSGTWRITCWVCGTRFAAGRRKSKYCSESCARIGRASVDPARRKLVKPIVADKARIARLHAALESAIGDHDGYAAGSVRIPLIGFTKCELRALCRIRGRARMRTASAGSKPYKTQINADMRKKVVLRRRLMRR